MNKLLVAACMAGFAVSAQANTYFEPGITYSSADLGNETFNQFLLSANVGYNFNPSEDFQHKVEAIVGVGVGNDVISGVDVKLDNYYGIAYRPTFKISDDFEAFGKLAIAKAKATASSGSESFSESSDFEAGYGVGLSYKSVSLSYLSIDDTDFLTVGYSFNF